MAALLVVLTAVASTSSCGGRGARLWARIFPADTVTVRVWHKMGTGREGWGPFTPVEWGWDSITWRAAAGDSLPEPLRVFNTILGNDERTGGSRFVQNRRSYFRIGRRFSRDSVLLYYRAVCLLPDGPPTRSDRETWDSVAVTRRPIYFSLDALGYPRFKIALLEWPLGKSAPPAQGDSIRGRMVPRGHDFPLMGAVFVLHTDLRALTDSTGRFVLRDVPRGPLEIYAVGHPHRGKGVGAAETTLVAPADSVVLLLRRVPMPPWAGSHL